jgi:S1-C subfamily serine protease
MKRLTGMLAACALAAIAVPAFAGSGEKCTQEAQVCLNHWSEYKGKGWIGIEFDKSGEAMVVKNVVAKSPAEKAGILAGDTFIAMNGASFKDKEALAKVKGEWKAGQEVTYTVMRKGVEKKIAVTLATMPDDVFAKAVGAHMIEDHMGATQTADAAKP